LYAHSHSRDAYEWSPQLCTVAAAVAAAVVAAPGTRKTDSRSVRIGRRIGAVHSVHATGGRDTRYNGIKEKKEKKKRKKENTQKRRVGKNQRKKSEKNM